MSLTTHVLDTATGKPRAAVPVELSLAVEPQPGLELDRPGLAWMRVTTCLTDPDGRATLVGTPDADHLEAGLYRMRFFLDGPAVADDGFFYPHVDITFQVGDVRDLHVPLLLSPFGYTTYRGS